MLAPREALHNILGKARYCGHSTRHWASREASKKMDQLSTADVSACNSVFQVLVKGNKDITSLGIYCWSVSTSFISLRAVYWNVINILKIFYKLQKWSNLFNPGSVLHKLKNSQNIIRSRNVLLLLVISYFTVLLNKQFWK